MNKILKNISFILFIFILPFSLIFHPAEKTGQALSSGSEARVIVSRAYLYTLSNFASEKVSYLEDDNRVLVVLDYNDTVAVQDFDGDFVYVKTQDEKEGYIYRYYITDNTSQYVYPVFNASLRKKSIVYDIEQKETLYTLKKDSRVYIYEGFDDKEKYTAVQVVLEDGSLYNGYVLTENVNPDGVSGLLIVAISVIIAGVTITLSLIFMKKKKKSKKNQ